MGFGNGMSIGWPNASAYSTPIMYESYSIYSCSGEEYLDSNEYPVDSFFPGYRVSFGGGNYGFINGVIPAIGGGEILSNFTIGDVNYRCNDSQVALSFEAVNIGPGTWGIRVYGNLFEGLDVISDQNTLHVTVNYYIVFYSESSGNVIRNGSHTFNIYSYSMTTGSTTLATDPVFTVPLDASFDYSELSCTSFSIDNVYGVYSTGSTGSDKFVTNYGNAWTFNWPTEP